MNKAQQEAGNSAEFPVSSARRELKRIEVIGNNLSLFKLVREEGHIIKQGDYYWIYEISYEGCEQCVTEETHKGWRNITNIILLGLEAGKNRYCERCRKDVDVGLCCLNCFKELRKEVFDEIEKNAPYRLMNDDWYVKIKSKMQGEKE
ncbi:MAG: hypothetical protein AABY10_02770 [Nanoarchaeota archaeon]